MNYAAHQFPIPLALVIVLFPATVNAAAWNIVPSIETSLTFADNITFQAKGNEEAETVLGVKPSVRVQSGEGRTQLGLIYGLDYLHYVSDPDRNSFQQLLRGNGSAILIRDLLFVDAAGSISYQGIKPASATNIGTLAISQDSTQVATWGVSPYFQQTIGGQYMWRAGINLGVVDYKKLLPDSFTREYFFNASSGPNSQDLLWQFDVKDSETHYEGDQLSDSRNQSVELDLRYKVLPDWALTGRVGYVDYEYEYDPQISNQPKGETWRAGVAWLPSTRTDLELGISRHFFGTTKYGAFFHQGRWLHIQANYEEVVTDRRQLHRDSLEEPKPDPLAPAPVDGRYLTEIDEVFINKITRLRGGYKSDEMALEVFGYRDHRITQNVPGSEVVAGGGVTLELILSRRASLGTNINRGKVDSINSTRTKLIDASIDIRRTFGSGLRGTISVQRSTRESTDPLRVDFVAHTLSIYLLKEF